MAFMDVEQKKVVRKKWTIEEMQILEETIEEHGKRGITCNAWYALSEAGFDRSRLAIAKKLREVLPKEEVIDTPKYRLRHPLIERLQELQSEGDYDSRRAVGIRIGNDFELQTYGEMGPYRQEFCPHCGEEIKWGEMVFAFFKYRYSQGWQAGRYHVECMRPHVEALPTKKGFCWVSGKWGEIKYVTLQNVAHRFGANQKALFEAADEYEQCKNAQERHLYRHKLREHMVEPTFKYARWYAHEQLIRSLNVKGVSLLFKEDCAVARFNGADTELFTLWYNESPRRWQETIELAVFDLATERIAMDIDAVERAAAGETVNIEGLTKRIEWDGTIEKIAIKGEEQKSMGDGWVLRYTDGLSEYQLDLLRKHELELLGLIEFGPMWDKMIEIIEVIEACNFVEEKELTQFNPQPFWSGCTPIVHTALA